jgi:hypothetical protein
VGVFLGTPTPFQKLDSKPGKNSPTRQVIRAAE